MKTIIPDAEYAERLRRFQGRIREAGLDACLVHGYESDCAYVRYLSDFWPTFEIAGIFVPAEGEAVLLVGPESENYAAKRSKIRTILRMGIYCESAEPDFPGVDFPSFRDVAAKAMPGRTPKRIGIAGWAVMNLPVYLELRDAFPDAEIVKACPLLNDLRKIKSENEIAALRKAFAISETAVDAILNEIRPGMTELQVLGIAQREIYRNGGEYEGHALYCFGGPNTNSGIMRPYHRPIGTNEMIQLNIGARVEGYASSVGLPFSIGPLPDHQRDLLAFGLEAHEKTLDLLRPGTIAGDVVRDYEAFVEDRGYAAYLMYGPCHGLGMMEVEPPWMESSSTYPLEPGMTFQVDTFFHDDAADFGLRWENGVVLTEDGVDLLSRKHMQIVTL